MESDHAEYPGDRSLQALFEARVDASPDTIAVSDGRRRLTYAQLDEESNRLAHLLGERGIGPNVVAGICIERSIDLIVAILGIVKSGGAYLPLDTKYPDDRRNFILANAKAAVLLTRSAIVRADAGYASSIIYLDDLDDIALKSSARPPSRTGGDDLAYVIYTSGSTGQPKGVAVRQRGVSRLVINTNYLAFSPSTVIAQVSNVSFDAATFEIWGALLNGGRLEILEDETILRAERLAAAIGERGVTSMFLTTALFHQAAHAKPDAFAGLQTLLVGGEVADPAAFRRVLDAGPPARLVNVYGPTEATTFASFHEVRSVPRRRDLHPDWEADRQHAVVYPGATHATRGCRDSWRDLHRWPRRRPGLHQPSRIDVQALPSRPVLRQTRRSLLPIW